MKVRSVVLRPKLGEQLQFWKGLQFFYPSELPPTFLPVILFVIARTHGVILLLSFLVIDLIFAFPFRVQITSPALPRLVLAHFPFQYAAFPLLSQTLVANEL